MKIKTTLILAIVFLLNFAIQAQETNPTKTEITKNIKPEKKYTAKDYADLAAKLKGGDTNIDFTALRLAYAETEDYSYHGPDKAEREKFYKPFGEKKYKDALKQAEKYLEKMYVDANAHYVAHISAQELKDDKKAEFHKTVLLGLLNSIQSGNDGLSAKTPFSVISVDEEYTMMRFLGYKHSSQSLQHLEGHTFDVMTATETKTSKEVKLYFNIDVVWAAEMKIFGK